MAASEKTLGDLHEKVAKALTEQVEGYEEPVLNEEGEEVATKLVRPSPSLLTAAIAFLKNNNITADPEQNEALATLNKRLAEKRKGKANQLDLDAAADRYAASQGFPLQ